MLQNRSYTIKKLLDAIKALLKPLCNHYYIVAKSSKYTYDIGGKPSKYSWDITKQPIEYR